MRWMFRSIRSLEIEANLLDGATKRAGLRIKAEVVAAYPDGHRSERRAVGRVAAQCGEFSRRSGTTRSPQEVDRRQSGRGRLMSELKGRTYSIHVHHGLEGVDPENGNVDVEVRFDDGSRYVGTFFTLNNLRSLFEKNERTGECRGGLYLWASDMVIVRELCEASISETVANLIAEGEFEAVFSKLTES